MLNHTKETSAAILQRHYLQAFQNQQVPTFKFRKNFTTQLFFVHFIKLLMKLS